MPLGAIDRPERGNGPERVSFGMLPIAKRDIERLRHVKQMLPRLTDPDLPPRAARTLAHRPSFQESLVWLEIFGDAPEVASRWAQVHAPREHPRETDGAPAVAADAARPDHPGSRRRRRRRRRGRRRRPETPR